MPKINEYIKLSDGTNIYYQLATKYGMELFAIVLDETNGRKRLLSTFMDEGMAISFIDRYIKKLGKNNEIVAAFLDEIDIILK